MRDWKNDLEERRSLRMALYEELKESPMKTYRELAEEFGINPTEANSLVVEYCKSVGIELPIRTINLKNRDKRNKDKLPKGTEIEIEDRLAEIVSDNYNTYVVKFFDDENPYVVKKKNLEVVRVTNIFEHKRFVKASKGY